MGKVLFKKYNYLRIFKAFFMLVDIPKKT